MLQTCFPPYLTASALSQPRKNRTAAAEEKCQISRRKSELEQKFTIHPISIQGLKIFAVSISIFNNLVISAPKFSRTRQNSFSSPDFRYSE